MALNKQTPAATTFEDPDSDDVAVETRQPASAQERLAAAAAERAAASASQQESTQTAVAAKPAGAVAVHRKMEDPFKQLENAFPVEWDTLRNLVITQGNVVDKDTDKPLGDEIGLELLSFQKQWVVSPGVDGEAAKEHVRYSDDGQITTKGDDVRDYLQHLKNTGYPKANLSERLVIVGSVFDIGVKGRKDLKDLQDALVQINLPPTSKATFSRYRMDQAYQIGKGLANADGADRIRINCNLKKNGDNTYTLANFSRYDAAAA
jgi:hypothetical protein